MEIDIKLKEKIKYEVELQIFSWPEHKKFDDETISFFSAIKEWGVIPYHPVRNASIWANDVGLLIRELLLSLINMISSARLYKEYVPEDAQSSHYDKIVSFNAKILFILIDILKDKIGLMVLSLLDDFNPEDKKYLPDFQKVITKLEELIKTDKSLHRKWVAETILEKISPLKNGDFEFVENFRHYKIHRMEPRIEIYGIKPHHDWPYLLRVEDKNVLTERKKMDARLQKEHPDKKHREILIKNCYINGKLFTDKRIEKRLYSYDDVENAAINCSKKLMDVTAKCFGLITPLLNDYKDLR